MNILTSCVPTFFPNCMINAEKETGTFFDVLLTVHLSIILAINQLNAQNLLL